ncbi:MAG: hypothetical protein HC805_04725 [Alkalinema sp. RL_2_19]|nr:hypothetical protein [Alkalinema sp. RL_2_19]
MSYDLGKPEESIKMLDRGIAALDPQRHDGAHTLWILRAFDQLLLLGDAAGASESYRQGAAWAAQAPDAETRKDAPILSRYSEFLKTDPDSTIVRFWAWNTIFAQAQATGNRKTQTRAKNELVLLGAIEGKNSDGQVMFSPPAAKPKPRPTPSSKPSPKASSMRVLKPNTSCMVQAACTKSLLKAAKKVKMTGNTMPWPNQAPSRNKQVEATTKGSATRFSCG